MTHINFIATLSAKQHRMLHRWWHFSLVLFVLVMIIIGAVQSKQLYTLYKTVAERNHLQERVRNTQDALKPYNTLKKEEEALRAQQNKIDQIYHTAERLHALLVTLYQTNQAVRIQSCKLTKTNFELTAQCVNTDAALHEIKRLRAVPQFFDVRLVALQQAAQGNAMIATVQGKIHRA